jgi:hypothetical protein
VADLSRFFNSIFKLTGHAKAASKAPRVSNIPRLKQLYIYLLCLGFLCLNHSLEAQNQHKRSQLEKSQLARVDRVSPNLNSNIIKGTIDLNASNSLPANAASTATINDLGSRGRLAGQVYPIPALETVITHRKEDGSYQLLK